MGLVKSHVAALMGGMALAIVAQQGAVAQNVNATNITLLERLVIGAGAPKVAINTPQAVTVINQADIDREQAATTGELFANVPGVTVVGSQRQFGEAFNIRGIGTTENSSDGSRIIINVDGAPKFNEQYRMGSFFSDPELYKQVEVLRGPTSSTLYGAGAIGGVINFTTKDASDFIQDGDTGAARIKTSYDSNGQGTLISGVYAQQITDTFEILAAGNWRRRDNVELANGKTLDGSAFNTLSGLIKGTAYFGDNDEQKLSMSYQRWFSDAKDQAYAQTGTADFGVTDRTVIDQTAVLRWENPATDNPWVDLKVNLSYSDTTNDQTNHRAVLGGPRTVIGSPSAQGPIRADSILLDTKYGYKTWQLSAENTVEWIGEGFENYFTTGFQASTQERSATRTPPATVLPQHRPGTENKIGVFAQNEFIWAEKLTLTAGARGDFHWVSSTGGLPNIEGSAFSPKLSAHYELTDNVGVFASYAHTERLPTIDELYADGMGKTTSLNLKKESADTYEVGFTLSGNDLLASGDSAALKTTAFYSDLANLIASNTATTPPAPAVSYYGNIGKARIYGVEVEASYDSELLYASLAYGLTIGDNLVNNTPLTTVPQSKVVLTAGVRNIEHDLDFGARLTVADKGRYFIMGSARQPIDGTADAFATVDLFATWKPDTGPLAGTQFQAGIDNVFNADFRENLAVDRSTGRTFKISVAKQFGW